ncbi:MAG: gliding motility lipoprotein GldH [Cyclobacteriaceae bacterium]
MRSLLGTVGLMLILWSCDPNRVMEDNKNLEGAYWHKDSVVRFDFEIADVGASYNVYANIRNAQHYPFYNLYYKYAIKDADGNEIAQKLESINLFDPKTGEPYGSGLGDLFDHRQLILENYRFPSAGNFEISLTQYMRRDSLPLILSMGARVEKAE